MKLPGFLLIGLTAIIIAVDALEISTTHLPTKTEVTGTSVHGKTQKTEKPITGTSVHDLTKTSEKPLGLKVGVTGTSVHGLTKKTEKPITGSSVRHLTVTENPLGQSEKKAIIYVLSEDRDRLGDAKFLPEMVDPMLCTHVVYAYAKMSDEYELIPTNPIDADPNGGYEQVNKLKEKNPNLQTLIAVGGPNSSFIEFANMTKNPETRLLFINSTLAFLEKHNFSGCSWDILNNASVESLREAKEHIVELVKDFSVEIKKETKRTGKQMLMTLTMPAKVDIIKELDFTKFIGYFNWINFEVYGMINDSLNVTQLHSALYPGNNTNEQNTVDRMVELLLSKGVPSKDIVLGMSTRGYGYELENPKNIEVGDAVVGPCPPGKFTMVPGWLAYPEICAMLNESSVNKDFLEKEKVNIVSNNATWISYDDSEAIEEKVNYLKEKNLAGYSIWNAGSDDFNGKSCNKGPFPLISTAYHTLMGSVTGKVRGSVTGKVTGGVTGSHPPLTKILERSTTLVHKMETTTIRK
jgi:GH18 family chitinase